MGWTVIDRSELDCDEWVVMNMFIDLVDDGCGWNVRDSSCP
jgi:hypothetical protein